MNFETTDPENMNIQVQFSTIYFSIYPLPTHIIHNRRRFPLHTSFQAYKSFCDQLGNTIHETILRTQKENWIRKVDEKEKRRRKRRENQHIRFGSVWVNLSVNLGISQIGSRLKGPPRGGGQKESWRRLFQAGLIISIL